MCRLRVTDCNRDNRELQKQTATVWLIDGLDIRGMGLAAPLGFSCGTFQIYVAQGGVLKTGCALSARRRSSL